MVERPDNTAEAGPWEDDPGVESEPWVGPRSVRRRRRRRPADEPERHDRWLVSYADFITLLFALFVVMYAVSSVNEGKYRVLADALAAAFEHPPRSLQPIQIGRLNRSRNDSLIELPVPAGMPQEGYRATELDLDVPPVLDQTGTGSSGMQDPQLEQVEGRLAGSLGGVLDNELVQLRRNKRRLELEIKSSLLYRSGSARLKPGAIPLLEAVATIVKDYDNPIRIEGHTDDVPIHTPMFLSNWELSAARAASVVHLFTDYGVDPARMAAVGYGAHRPIADNATEAGRAANRRVVIVLLPEQNPRWRRAVEAVTPSRP